METQFEPSRLVGPEDLAVGDFVTVSHETYEWVGLCDGLTEGQEGVRRVTVMPSWSGRPMRVVGVCLPYALVEDPRGRHRSVDLRRYRFARLSPDYGALAFDRIKAEREEKVGSR